MLEANDTCARLLAELRKELAEQERRTQELRVTVSTLEARVSQEASCRKHHPYAHMTTREAVRSVLHERAGTAMTNGEIVAAMEEGGWRTTSNGNTPSIVARALAHLRSDGEIRRIGHGRYVVLDPWGTRVDGYESLMRIQGHHQRRLPRTTARRR